MSVTSESWLVSKPLTVAKCIYFATVFEYNLFPDMSSNFQVSLAFSQFVGRLVGAENYSHSPLMVGQR